MGVVVTENESVSSVAPARLYKAMVFDSPNIFPKAMPDFVKSVEIEGDGGPGSIKKLNLAQGYLKQKVDLVDAENYVYHYTTIEGIALTEQLEKISFEYKLVAKHDGGCIIKSIVKYYTKGDSHLSEQFIKTFKEKSVGYTKLVEDYLLAHPDYDGN